MRKLRLTVLWAVVLCLPVIANAQVDTAWVRYSPEAGVAHDVAIDESGAIYVSGSTRMINYDPDGNVLWNTTIGATGAGLFKIYFGAPGQFYTAGAVTVRKRGTDGTLDWVRSFDEVGARGYAADAQSRFYVTGTAGTRRYLADASFWSQFGGAGSRVAVDADGSMYVMRGATNDYVLSKLRPDGSTGWQRSYNGPGNSTDDAIELYLDSAANAFVTGKSIGVNTGYDFATLKYDSAGNLLWASRYARAGSGDDIPVDLEVDRNGNAFVLGNSALVKYDSAGVEQWALSLLDWTGFVPVAMKPDSAGNVFIVGKIGSSGNYDFFSLSVSGDGAIRWIHRFDTTLGANDVPYAIAVSADGEAYAVGEHTQSGSTRYMTLKFEYQPCADADADGWCDAVDNCPNNFNPAQTDYDADGIGDSCDTCPDIDGDGFGYPASPPMTCGLDNCPTTYNPSQSDADSDGKGDDCDNCTDSDGDKFGDPGYPLNTCPEDNCPMVANPEQEDFDFDNVGDSCDLCNDIDNDGYADTAFVAPQCPPDNCPALRNIDQMNCRNVGDPVTDGVIDVLDVVRSVDYAFRGQMPEFDSTCAGILRGGTDVNCDSFTTVLDVVSVINVAFRNATDDFCRPCECDCYPESCDSVDTTNNLLANNGSFEKYCHGTLDGWTSIDGVLVNVPAPGAGRWGIFNYCQIGCHPQWGMEAVLTDTLPAGVYSFSIAYKPLESGLWGGISYDYGSEYGGMWINPEDTVWTTISFADTLSAQEPPPPYFFFLIWGNGYFDAAAVRYLGPVTP